MSITTVVRDVHLLETYTAQPRPTGNALSKSIDVNTDQSTTFSLCIVYDARVESLTSVTRESPCEVCVAGPAKD